MEPIVAIQGQIVSTLLNDPDLQAFAATAWGKPVTVTTSFRHRAEIAGADLPLILVVRPTVAENPDLLVTSSFRVISGFQQDDESQAVDDAIGYGEKIRKALRKNRRRGGYAQNTIAGPLVIDEGYGHPVYFSITSLAVSLYPGQIYSETSDKLLDELNNFLADENGDTLTW